MNSYELWTLRLWFIEVSFLKKGKKHPEGLNIGRFNFKYLSRKYFVGKREMAFFKGNERLF